MNREKLMQKAGQAASSAALLLSAGDIEGACNRAYYAMFDAAKAALLTVGTPENVVESKSHSGIIQAFGLYVVKPGHLSPEFGRAFRRVEDLRGAADYTGRDIPPEKAQHAVEAAVKFIQAVQELASTGLSGEKSEQN